MTGPRIDTLFRPLSIGSMQLENRIVMAPMTRYFAPGGVLNHANTTYYRRRAEGAVGLIVSEGTSIDRPAARNHPGIPLFHGDAALAGWKDVIDAVHQAGSRMAPQLWHCGSIKSQFTDWVPEAPTENPSGINAPGEARGQAMSEEAIADTVAAFATAAAEAKRLGFDAVELHGAHGYLIDEFFWTGTNERTDRYGGATIRERSRFAGEVVTAVRKAVGPDYPLILRISQWKTQDYAARVVDSPALMAEWLEPLVEAGANVLHCSQRRFWEPEFPEVDGEKGLNLAGWAKKVTGATTISVGSVGLSSDFAVSFGGGTAQRAGLEQLTDRMEREEFDLIAVGRALMGDADWAAKIKSGDSASLKDFEASSLAEFA